MNIIDAVLNDFFWRALIGGLGVALVAGDGQRRVAIVAGLVHVGVRSKQLRNNLGVAPLAGHHERRVAKVVCQIDIGVRS